MLTLMILILMLTVMLMLILLLMMVRLMVTAAVAVNMMRQTTLGKTSVLITGVETVLTYSV